MEIGDVGDQRNGKPQSTASFSQTKGGRIFSSRQSNMYSISVFCCYLTQIHHAAITGDGVVGQITKGHVVPNIPSF